MLNGKQSRINISCK